MSMPNTKQHEVVAFEKLSPRWSLDPCVNSMDMDTVMHHMGRCQPRGYAVLYSHINNLYRFSPPRLTSTRTSVQHSGVADLFPPLDFFYCSQSLALITQMNAEETMTLSTCFHRSWVAAILVKCTRLVIGRLADTKSSLFAS